MKRLTGLTGKLRAVCAQFDGQDVFLAGGAVLVPVGIGLMYTPAGLIAAGLQFYVFALFLERLKRIADRSAVDGGPARKSKGA